MINIFLRKEYTLFQLLAQQNVLKFSHDWKDEYDDEKSFDELLAELPDELTEGLPELISEFKELSKWEIP